MYGKKICHKEKILTTKGKPYFEMSSLSSSFLDLRASFAWIVSKVTNWF